MLHKYKKKLIISAVFIVVAIFVMLLYWGISYYKELKTPKSPVLSAIPISAGIIFEFNNTNNFYKKISSETDFWKILIEAESFSELNKQIVFIDSLFKSVDDANSIIENYPLHISLHPAANNTINILYLTEAPANKSISHIEDICNKMFNKKAKLTKSDFKNVQLLEVISDNIPYGLYFSVYKGVIFFSSTRILVEDAILQLNNNQSYTTNTTFTEVAKTAGKRVDANVYINYAQLHKIILNNTADEYKANLAFMSDFAAYSGLDVNIKNNSIVLNGFTNTLPDNKGFLSLMLNQKPQKIELTRILPHNTSSFLFFGFENFKQYFAKHKNQKTDINKNIETEIENFENSYKINVENDIINQISSEVAYVSITDKASTNETLNYLIVKFKEKEQAENISKVFNSHAKTKIGSAVDATDYRDYTFGYIDNPEIFNTILSTSFELFNLKNYTIIDNYFILGHSRNALINIINAHIFNRNLNNNVTYNNFTNILSAKANIYMYYNFKQSIDILKNFTSSSIANNIEKNKYIYSRFESLAIQISENNGLFYNNISLSYNDQETQDSDFSLWETELENPSSQKMFKIKNHNDNSNDIVIIDNSNNLYLIDQYGNILWKNPIGEKILSDIHQIDYYNNGKFQLLFNTTNFICLIDRNGKNVVGFPKKIQQRATNGLSVFDYDNSKNYRIFIATEKNEIINLDKNAEKVTGWKIFKTKNAVTKPIQFIRLLGKDFLIASDEKGQSYILNRQGEIRIKPDKNFEMGQQSKFYHFITTDNKGKLITTDIKGKIIAIDFNGKTDETFIADFSPLHYFLFDDINNNSIKNYIFIDDKRLAIYDLNKNLLKEHILDGIVETAPFYFEGTGKYKLGILTNNAKLYLFNSDLDIVEGFPIDGTTPFIMDATEKGKKIIVAANNKIVFKYLLE